jgi:acid phosphatase family membrane protein YuiD
MEGVALSPFLIAAAIAWISAQLLKYVFAAIRNKSMRQYRQFYLSGSMPSAHSATVVAMATTIGIHEGVDSAIFALSVLFAAVVMYDALMVRRSSGEQGIAILRLLKDMKSKIVPPRVAKGHLPTEVAAGALLGFAIGVLTVIVTGL